jgi:hypothetical protein
VARHDNRGVPGVVGGVTICGSCGGVARLSVGGAAILGMNALVRASRKPRLRLRLRGVRGWPELARSERLQIQKKGRRAWRANYGKNTMFHT